MGKIQDIEALVKRCDEVIMGKYENTAEELVNLIRSVYSQDIPDIDNGLNLYAIDFYSINNDLPTKTDFIGDLRILQARLIHLKNDLEEKENRRKEELEIIKYKSSGINITNTNSANSSSNSSVSITIQQTLDKLNTFLPPSEIDELEGKLSALELAIHKNDKEKTSSKMSSVLKFIADKGIDVAIAVIPYLASLI